MAAVDWPLSAMHKSPEGELLIETSREGPYSSLRGLRVEWGETDTEVCSTEVGSCCAFLDEFSQYCTRYFM